MADRRLRLFCAAAFLLAGACAAPAALAAGHRPAGPGGRVAQLRAVGLADRIAALGDRYPGSFGGLAATQAGRLTVYVVSARGNGFLAAVRAAGRSAGQRYSVRRVPHSWQRLEHLMITIAQAGPAWRARGIALSRWGPEPGMNKVLIQLRSPSTAAARALRAAYGASWVAVSRTPFREKLMLADRFHSNPPFPGGARINGGHVGCTDSFAMLNRAGHSVMLTAGHCGSRHPWRTNRKKRWILGSTSANYLNGFGGHTFVDIQHIWPGHALRPAVWGNGRTLFHPITTFTPQLGSRVCFDGATTGLKCEIRVTNPGPFCQALNSHELCWLAEARAAAPFCHNGDSGGPVFQRTPVRSQVRAAGSISLHSFDGKTCIYTQLSQIESQTKVTLMTQR
jgi:hypothetical protein